MENENEEISIDQFLCKIREQDYTFTKDELKTLVDSLERNLGLDNKLIPEEVVSKLRAQLDEMSGFGVELENRTITVEYYWCSVYNWMHVEFSGDFRSMHIDEIAYGHGCKNRGTLPEKVNINKSIDITDMDVCFIADAILEIVREYKTELTK